MSDPPLLDYIARARTSDPQTSHDAAASVKRISEAQEAILSLLSRSWARTDEEIYEQLTAVGFRISPSGCRSRRAELVALGKVTAHSEPGRTQAGRRCTIWATRENL